MARPELQLFAFSREATRALTKRSLLRAHLIAWIAVAVGGFLSALWIGFSTGEPVIGPEWLAFLVFGLLILPVLALGLQWIMTGLYHAFAILLGGKGSIRDLFAVRGHILALHAFFWLPIIQIFAIGYALALDTLAIMTVHKFSWKRAVPIVAMAFLVTAVSLFALSLTVALLLAVAAGSA